MRKDHPPGDEPGGFVLWRLTAEYAARTGHREQVRRVMAVVKLPDGSKREVADDSSVMQVAESIGRGLAKAAVAGKVDGKVVDLASKIGPGEHELSILTDRDGEALFVLRHSTAHVMA